MYLHRSKAIVEEAGVQAGSFFFFLTAHPASEVWRRYTRPAALSFDLYSFHVNCQDSNRMQDFYLSVVFSEKFQLNWKAGAQGCCCLLQYSYPCHLGESDCSHGLAQGVRDDVLIAFSSFLSTLILIAEYLILRGTVYVLCVSAYT